MISHMNHDYSEMAYRYKMLKPTHIVGFLFTIPCQATIVKLDHQDGMGCPAAHTMMGGADHVISSI